eukprot:scaffold155482_cov58-Attheya_sp.AAC.3
MARQSGSSIGRGICKSVVDSTGLPVVATVLSPPTAAGDKDGEAPMAKADIEARNASGLMVRWLHTDLGAWAIEGREISIPKRIREIGSVAFLVGAAVQSPPAATGVKA